MPYFALVKKDELHRHIRELWLKTAIPLNMANLRQSTNLSGRKLETMLSQLVADSTLHVESDDDGGTSWTVPGAQRPVEGPRTFEERDRLARLMGEVQADFAQKEAAKKKQLAEAKERERQRLEELQRQKQQRDQLEISAQPPSESEPSSAVQQLKDKFNAATALSVASEARGELDKPRNKGEKSLLVSGGLSLVLGPIGWLYAGSLRETIPASAAYLAVAALVTKVIPIVMLMPVLMVAFPVSGIAGLLYAWQYNRKGQRTRLFTKEKPRKKKKQKKLARAAKRKDNKGR